MDPAIGAVGPVAGKFADVRRIAVLRGGGLGDVLFALPAASALAAAYPEARLTLLGTPLHAELFAGRPGPIHSVEVLPFVDGVRQGPVDPIARDEFVARMRAEAFDLAVQLHGGGRFSNPFLLELGARHSVGTATPDARPLERSLPYVYYQHEVLRALEVVGLAGARARELNPTLALTAADAAALAPALASIPQGTRLLVLHPGASDPRRRWAAERFAQVAHWAARDGFAVLVVGDASERELADDVVRLSAAPVRSVAGQLGIRGLVGLLAAADVVVANDSGPRHLAQAVGTPTVGIYWVGNTLMAAPFGRARHRIHSGWTTHCPQCGIDVTQTGWTAPRCDHVFGLNDAVRPEDVYADVLDLTRVAVW